MNTRGVQPGVLHIQEVVAAVVIAIGAVAGAAADRAAAVAAALVDPVFLVPHPAKANSAVVAAVSPCYQQTAVS